MRVLFKPGLAALSKPRCGSTSLRRMLTPHMQGGDIKCDRANDPPPFILILRHLIYERCSAKRAMTARR